MFELLMLVGALCFLVIAGILVADLVRNGGQALSWRNVFLVGYALFFCSAPAFLASEKYSNPYYVPSGQAISMLVFFIPTFLALFLIADWAGKKMSRASRIIPTCRMPLSAMTIYVLVGSGMCIAILITALPIDSFIGLLLAQFRDGLLAGSVGLCTYFLIAQKRNPLALGLFLLVLPVAAVISTTGSIGRRSIISIFFITGWVAYYFYLRYRSHTTRLTVLAAGGVALVLLITIYSSFRGQFAGVDKSSRASIIMGRFTQFKDAALNPKIDKELLWSLLVTDPSIYTGYLFDMVPTNMARQPFHGAIFFISNPIPRRVWSDKPTGIGKQVQDLLNLQFNVGPGILGHGWLEGGAIGVFGYAIFFGLLVGVVDASIRSRLDQPLFIIAVGTSLGNIIGLARGETSLFLLLISSAFAASMGLFIITNLVAGKVLAAFPALPHPASSIPPDRLDPGALAMDSMLQSAARSEPQFEDESYSTDAELAEMYWSHDEQQQPTA